ncbi:phospholipase D-like domain-containing protein [Lewinella sp. IMCC34183]|uniref:phospholipase D-like domain-containing protein n=1 Tax=Lewinella sp. IMCC34183 TaxID=2248762 RepID=UPI001300722A|nr:phospholipase D-like domain-containing protein [Lewinella sp. IMCC34183]
MDNLSKAETEIVAALAWFTDVELVNLLTDKAQTGVKVDLVLAKNSHNEEVDFSALEAAGGSVTWITTKGYGLMHNKFCVVDEQVAITGSYNWTVNAKRNNGENILVTADPVVVKQYRDQFFALKSGVPIEEAEIYGDAGPVGDSIPKHKMDAPTGDYAEFEKEWNHFLNSRVVPFERNLMKSYGAEIAESTQGNAEVIPQQLDSIYQQLLSDTEINHEDIEVLKRSLEQKISFHEAKNSTANRNAIHVAEMKLIARKRVLENQITSLENERDKTQQEILGISDTQIPILEKKRLHSREEIDDLSREAVKRPSKKRVWPEVALLIGLTFYLVLFYSSVMYNILYGKADARLAGERGGEVVMEVFNANAIWMALDRGLFVLSFILIFTAIPLAVGYLLHRITGWTRWIYGVGALLLDLLLAYIITKAIYEVRYEETPGLEPWDKLMVLSSGDFYLVLTMGFVSFLIWGGLLDHIYKQLDTVSKSESYEVNEEKKSQLLAKVAEYNSEIETMEEKKLLLSRQNIDTSGKITALQNDLAHTDYEMAKEKLLIDSDYEDRKHKLQNLKETILLHLNRERIPVSMTSLKDRVSTFLSGWDDWLYDYYASTLATERSHAAHNRAKEWLQNKRDEIFA